MRPDAVRVLISDLLSPEDATAVTRELAARAGGLAVVQVLSEPDTRPEAGDALRLVDAETHAAVDVVLDRRTVEAYLARLARLEAAWADAVQRRGGLYTRVLAEHPLEDVARGPLLRAGVVAPA
jgi:hypothetical protein